MGFICLQTISLVYLVTAVVGVETWYQPVLWNLLYRDLFTFMIIGEVLTPVVISIIFFYSAVTYSLLISSLFLHCDSANEPLQCPKVGQEFIALTFLS